MVSDVRAVLLGSVACLSVSLGASRMYAQGARAQSVMLRVTPHVGDTLRMRMDQTVELHNADGESASRPFMTATVRVSTRAVVLRRSAAGAELLSIIDNVEVEPAAAAAMPPFSNLKRALDNREARMRMASDGRIQMLDDHGNPSTRHGGPSAMPGMLPSKAVSVGETWVRDIVLPLNGAGDLARNAPSTVRATFRLDSLGPDQSIAYVSLRGTFAHVRAPTKNDRACDTTSGTFSGSLQLDRRVGWITDSHMNVALTSVVRRPGANPPRKQAGKAPPPMEPMQVRMKITQWLRAVPRP